MSKTKLPDITRHRRERPSSEKIGGRPRSVNMTADHLEFLDEYNVNLSGFVREALDAEIKKHNWEPRSRRSKGN